MKYFSIPSDFKKSTLDEYDKLNKKYHNSKVIETYGSITSGKTKFGSGRLAKDLGKIDYEDLEEYISYSRSKNIDFNYTLNSTTMHNLEFTQSGIRDIQNFVSRLYEIGVRSMTVALPPIMEIIQSMRYDIKLKASVLCQINNVSKALSFKKLGVERIVVDESLNRSFYYLKEIKEAFGNPVEVIVNQLCHRNCIYRMFHYNMTAEDFFGNVNKSSVDYYEHRCVMQQFNTISDLLKLSWIRPEDLHYYTESGINHFKLQGRHTFLKGGDPVKTVTQYFNENFDGNLMDLLYMYGNITSFKIYIDNKKLDGFIKPFFNKKDFCDNNCLSCNHCQIWSKKCIDYIMAEEIIDYAKSFYAEYDSFKKLLK